MGITSKDVRTYLWVFLEFSMRLCCTFAREHPLASLFFVIFLVLYVFLTTIFWFLIYSLPFVLIAAVIIKITYFPEVGAAKRENADPKPSGKIKLSEDEERRKKAIGRAQSVRRRKSKKDFPPYVEEDGGSIFPPAGFSEHEVVDKSPLTEENMKDIREVEVDPAECSSSDASQSLCVEGLSKGWRKSFRVMDESDDNEMTDSSENEGGRRREKNKGVRWSQEDQKSLMDLSEMERNKRLESLMARRRARRLVSLHVRRTLMNIGSDDPPISIVIPRTNAGSSSPFSPTPGSAPSVLLPAHNPFDLPYDQHEEKPNLRGGSFHQDFMVPNQDIMFCRHESFTLGPSFNQNFRSKFPHRFKLFEMPEGFGPRSPFVNKEDAADRVIEQVTVEEPDELNRESTSDVKEQASADPEEDGSEVQIKSVLIEDIDDRTSSSSSEEDDEPFYRIDKDAILKSLSTPSSSRNIAVDSPESLNPGPSMSQKARMEEHYYYANGAMLPTPSHSVASDLQVEVSEIGSPPRSVDGASSMEEEISVYNRELEKDTASSNECTLAAPSRPSRLDENESRSREVHEVTEQDLVKSGFSNINPTLHIPPERVIQQDPVDSSSFADSHAHKSGERTEIIELVKRNSSVKIGEELEISEASESPADTEASFPPEPVFEQAHVASAPTLISEIENDTSNSDQEARVEVQDVNVHTVENDTSVLDQEARGEVQEHKVENDSSNLLLNDQMAQHSFSPAEADKNGENSMSIKKNDVREVTQDRAVEPPSERGFSAANQSEHSPQPTLLIPESRDEHVPNVSSSSTSPISQPMFSMNQDSSSSFVSKIHSEDQQYGFAERRGEDLGSSMVNQRYDDPESVAEQISTSSSSSSSSPTSISHTKFSLDLASSNWDQEPQMEVPQSQNQIAETTHQVTDEISNPTTSHESLADIPTVHHQVGLEVNHVSSDDHKKSSDESSSNTHVNASMIQEREILNIDSAKETEGLAELEIIARCSESYDHDRSSEETRNNHVNPLVIHEDTQNKDSAKETEGLPELETTAPRSESYDHDRSSEETRNNHMIPLVIHEDTQNKDSIVETKGLSELETSAHHSEPHDREKYYEETSTSNHTNTSVIPEEVLKMDCTEKTESLPKPEITTDRLESNDHEKSSKETSSDNHTNAPVIPEEILKIDCTEAPERLPKPEMTTNRLESNDHEKSSKETSSDNHTNASVIPEEVLKIDCTEDTESLPKPEMITNRLESNDHENSSKETSSDNHTNASVIPEEILKIDCTEKTESLPKPEMTTNRLELNDHEKPSKETSSDSHTNAPVIPEKILKINCTEEVESLPKPEMTTNRLESNDHEKSSKETNSDSHTNAPVIPEEILKIDCTEAPERLPKPGMTTNNLESNDHEKSSKETSSDNHTNASVIQEKEIQNTDSIKEAGGPPELEMTESELPRLNEERGHQGPSMAENKEAKMTEGAAHLEGTVQKPLAEETSTTNHTNAAPIIPEEILKIDCTEETERLPKPEMTTNRLESNDHEKSSKETSSDNHTNASVIEKKEIQNTDSIKKAGGPPELDMTESGLPRLNEERGPQGPSMAENKEAKMTEGAAHLEGTVQKPVAEETSTSNHTNAAPVIPEEILKIDYTEETERLPKPEITTNRLESNDHEKPSKETSNDNHTNVSVIQEKEIQNTDSIKKAGGPPELGMTESELPRLNEERGHQGPSMAENKEAKMTEGAAHLNGTVQKPVSEETSTSNHTNAASAIPREILKIDCTEETERLPKPEMTTNRSESNDHETSSNYTNRLESNVASVIPEEILKIDSTEETERLPKLETTTNRLESNDHETSSNETRSDNHTNASVIQPVAEVKSDVNNVVESESRNFTVNQVSNFDVSKAVNEKSDSTPSVNSIEREATPDLSEKPVENEREIPNLNIVNNDNEKAPTFQGSHEGESSQGLPSPDSVTKQPQTSQSVHPSKGEDPEGEQRIPNEADAATSASRGDAGKDDDRHDSEKPMNSENAADHLKANEANIGSGERDHSNTNLKD
nr:probable GPI-anchored adhesin-like protein PGA55 [Ipomoea batatas]